MYADTRKSTSNFREIEAARFARNLVLSSRLLATFLRPLEMKLLVSFVDIVEEIYKLHQNAAEKMVKVGSLKIYNFCFRIFFYNENK